MKVRICKVGPVNEVSVNISPLTIFVGPNNSGKTWVAYSIAAILGRNGYAKYRQAYAKEETKDRYPPLDNAIQQIFDEGSAKIDLREFAGQYGEEYINSVARLARSWLSDFMATDLADFKSLEFAIDFGDFREEFLETVTGSKLEEQLSIGRRRRTPLLKGTKESGESELYFYTSEDVSERLPAREIRDFVAGNVFLILQRAICRNVYTLPMERTTFITFPLLKRRTSNDESPPLDEQEDSTERSRFSRRLATPLGDFMYMFGVAADISLRERLEIAHDEPRVGQYISLAESLERDVLGGGIQFSPHSTDEMKELNYQPSKDVNLEISVSSSMVKELAPLVLYLRHLAMPRDWLVIDEPEMNLHPEAQVRLIEFLTMLVNADLRLIITTHSSYMIDHLSNLMKAARYDNHSEIADRFFLKNTEAFISSDNVSVYLFQSGTATSIVREDGSIDWGTFGRVADKINEIYFSF